MPGEGRQMTVEEMVELNNERRKQLNDENRKYYEEMIIYLRMSSVAQRKVEELLLEMLDHLLMAQQQGRTAKEVFGADPEAYCKEVVQSLDKQSLFYFPRFAFIFSVGLYVIFIIDGLYRLTIDPLLHHFFGIPLKEGFAIDSFILPVFGSFLVEFMMFFLRKSTFKSLGWQIFWIFLLQAIILGGFLLWNFILKNAMPVIPIPAWLSLLIGGLLWVIHRVLFKVIFKHVEIF